MNILLVDDSNFSLRVNEAHLKREGHNVQTATSPDAALKILSGEIEGYGKPDILLTDYDMKTNKTGVELAKEAKEMHPEMPVILMSANEMPELVKEKPELPTLIENGTINGYFHRSQDVSELIAMVNNLGPNNVESGKGRQ